MDYCIYKTINGARPRVIHTFTQAATKSRAKSSARRKLTDMILHVKDRPVQFKNLKEEDYAFSYEFMVDTEKSATARFYIAPAPKEEKSTLKK